MADSDNKVECISALIDGETTERERDEALDLIAGDDGQARRWEHYHLISDALRNNLPAVVDCDIAGRVREAIAAEPTVLAPGRWRERVMAAGRQVTGFAVAASVAVVVVLGVWSNEGPDAGSGTETVAAGIQQPDVDIAASQLATHSGESTRERLNSYIVNHNEYARSAGVNSMLPYMRIVGHNQPATSHRVAHGAD